MLDTNALVVCYSAGGACLAAFALAIQDGALALLWPALALGAVALRNTALVMPMLEKYPRRDEAIELLAEGFDMLEEDLDKERFFAFARRTFWDAAAGYHSGVLIG